MSVYETKKTTESSRREGTRVASLRNLGLGTVVFVGAIYGWGTFRSGSIQRALPYLLGQRVFVESPIDLGTVRCGVDVSKTISIVNCGVKELSIVGARKSCSCIGTPNFPIAVPAGITFPLEVKIGSPKSALQFNYSVELYIAEEGASFKPFSIALTGTSLEE